MGKVPLCYCDGCAAFFDGVFQHVSVHSIYDGRGIDSQDYITTIHDVHLTIIDKPAERLAKPLLSFAPVEEARHVQGLAAIEPSARDKPVAAIVRGMGGGKTRCLEELHFALLQTEGVLPLAFTYNCGMQLRIPEEFLWTTKAPHFSEESRGKTCYALTVVARLAAVLYGRQLGTVIKEDLRPTKDALALAKDDDNLPRELIRGFIVHAVRKVRSTGTKVDTVVVLANEVLKAEREFDKRFDMRRDVWVVAKEEGNDRSGTEPSPVKIQDGARIANLKVSVKEQFTNMLEHVDAAQLQVYTNEGALLRGDQRVQDMEDGATYDQPVLVKYLPPTRAGPLGDQQGKRKQTITQHKKAVSDITSVLRDGVLNECILGDLQAALLLSSLAPSPAGETTSGRRVRPVVLPPLRPADIVDLWWERGSEMEDLAGTAAALCEAPRAVQYAAEYINTMQSATRTDVVKLLESVVLDVNSQYEPRLLTKEHLRAVVYQEEVKLDEAATTNIMDSMFTNTITNFKEHASIVPTASLVLLAAGAARSVAPCDMVDCADLLCEFLSGLDPRRDGDVLEWAMAWWLQLRLAVVTGAKGFTLSKLFSLESMIATPFTPLEKVQGVAFDVPGVVRVVNGSTTLPDSHTDPNQFLQALDNITPSPGEAVILRPHAREAFDLLLAIMDVAGRTFVTLLDQKSAARDQKRTGLPNNGDVAHASGGSEGFAWVQEASHMHQVARRASHGYKTKSLAGALGQGNYAFLYMTSYEGASFGDATATVVSRREMKRFLGPLWEVYRAIRTAV